MSVPSLLSPAAEAGDLGGLSGWVVDIVGALGAVGLGLVVAIENVFPPIPSELVLPLGGFLAGRGELGLADVMLWSTAGSVGGALALYAFGAILGTGRMTTLLARLPLIDADDVDRAVAWFGAHGERAVLFGRLVPFVRSLVSVPAGAQRMRLTRFTLYTTVGSGVWNALLVGAGYLLGQRWTTVSDYTVWLDAIVVLLVVVGIGRLVQRRLQRRRTRQT